MGETVSACTYTEAWLFADLPIFHLHPKLEQADNPPNLLLDTNDLTLVASAMENSLKFVLLFHLHKVPQYATEMTALIKRGQGGSTVPREC